MNTFSATRMIQRLAKLATLLALAAGSSAALPSCTAGAPEELVQQDRAAACSCPSDNGTCGAWKCVLNTNCVFEPDAAAGDRCTSAGSQDGVCMPVMGDGRLLDSYLMCCTGCLGGSKTTPVCHPGTEVGYCGDRGAVCDSCSACQSCTGGTCRSTTGNSCGTCKVCDAGSCVDEDPGATCSVGRCALGATCCSSCIDGNGACLSSTSEHCGLDGAACRDCGQCGTCSDGACQATTGGDCDDGDPCTEDDTCAAGSCAGTPIPVNDGNDCTTDACGATTGVTHTNVMPGTPCDDGAMCTTAEECNDHDNDSDTLFTCLDTGGVVCMDGNPCTSDTPPCGSMTCAFSDEPDGTACSTNDRCVLSEACASGECAGEARNCNDDNPCTTDSCVSDMNDPDADPITGCKHVPRATSTTCDDANPCTESDHCQSDGRCAGTTEQCTALDACHAAGSCDPGRGECDDERLADGTACENTGTCASGVCQGGTPTGTGGTGGSGAGGSGTGGSDGGEAGAVGTPSGGDGNDAGAAGENASGGSSNAGRGGSSSAGRGGSSIAGSAGADGPLYVRDPGGCSCSVPGTRGRSDGYLALLATAGLTLVSRRRRSGPGGSGRTASC